MSKEVANDLFGIVLGSATALTIGGLVLQALGTFVLGVLGAAGGYVFVKYIKPWLERKFPKKEDKA